MPTLGIIADEGKPSREVARIIEPMLTDVHRDTEENDTRVIHGTYPGVGPVEVRVETLPMTPSTNTRRRSSDTGGGTASSTSPICR